MATERLFDIDAKEKKFTARVLSCVPTREKFTVVLDRTLFFPEEGGQTSDTGVLGGVNVTYAYEKDRVIYHECDGALPAGELVDGEIAYGARFRKMQNHTGEHIISGITHALYGYNNVGFHLGLDSMTIDFDGYLSREQLEEIELLANGIVIRCLPIRAYYPDEDELVGMSYRSKLELTENVRIVEIEGVDMCACCAPHVSNTGEVGIIKILDTQRYKGGVRIWALCGLDALEDYGKKYRDIYDISTRISEPQATVVSGLDRVLAQIEELKIKNAALRRENQGYKLDKITATEGNICLFWSDGDMKEARFFANEAVGRCGGMCAIFMGDDGAGYKFLIMSESVDLKAKMPDISASLSARGGGSPQMVTGTCTAKREVIEKFFE